jgi:hypothetical protein
VNGDSRSRVIGVWLSILILALPALARADTLPDGRTATWRELARLPVRGDTVVARGLCLVRSPGDSTFLRYRIETRGRVWTEDALPEASAMMAGDEDSCDLWCELCPIPNGFAAKFSACYLPSYPECWPEFLYVASSQASVMTSGWTEAEWEPSRGDSAVIAVERDCVSYSVPLIVHRERASLAFTRAGDVGEVRVPASNGRWCFVSPEADTARMVPVYATAVSHQPHLMKIPGGTSVEVLAAWLRVKGTTPREIEVDPRRIEARVGKVRVFLDPDAMTTLGFEDP